MKRVFTRKKGESHDGDEDYIHFLEDYLLSVGSPGDFPKHRKNWKITIIVEDKP